MKTLNLNLLALLSLLFVSFSVYSQSVPFPSNPNPNVVAPWGYTQVGTNWDTSPYLPFIYDYHAFRLMPPNGVTYNSGNNSWSFDANEKYPIILFFHGKGESGNDNNNQLKHGGQRHRDAVLSGEFPGFLVYPQNISAETVKSILDALIDTGLPIDQTRVYIHGLSNGAKFVWNFALSYPEVAAAVFPMSGMVNEDDFSNYSYDDLVYTPFRVANGGLDKNPNPVFVNQEAAEFAAAGGQMERFYLPELGHGTWNAMYNRSDFFSWFLEHKANKIYAKFNYSDVCPEDAVDVTLGVNPRHNSYEWRKNGVLITGQNQNQLHVTEYGDYTVRINIDGTWTEWSDVKTVGERQPTQTPPIAQISYQSVILPDPNGSTSVSLGLPDGYEVYEWYKDGVLAGTSQTINATPGVYRALVQELYGCSSLYSDPFVIFSNTGVGVPTVPSNISVATESKTVLNVAWSDNSSDETGFELYRRKAHTGAYSLLTVLAAGTTSYVDTGLEAGTEYSYSLRAINENGASVLSTEVSATTDRDQINPTAPKNLTVVSTTNFSVSLEWDAATDDVGVKKYDIYQDGVKVLSTTQTAMTVYNLVEAAIYKFQVVAVDYSGNESVFSNRVVASPVFSGLNYKYFEGTWSSLPNFNALTPVKEGISDDVDISISEVNDRFAFYWEGYIKIPVAGSYTFETYSDDGSKLYIGDYDENDLVVNNDGAHGSQYREGTYVFPTAGAYPIVITYFEATGGNTMRVYWKNTAHGVGSRQLIPSNAFSDEVSIPTEVVVAPSDVVATATAIDEIALTWLDNSSNEISFQIFRSDGDDLNYTSQAILPAGTTQYTDTDLLPETTYYYQVVALGNYTESSVATVKYDGILMQLELDDNIDDESGNYSVSTYYRTPIFDSNQIKQGSHSLHFHATADYVNLDNGNKFIHNAFTERSVAFWLYTDTTVGIQDVFEEGSNVDGYAIRINNGVLEFVVQISNNKTIISAPVADKAWVHVATSFDNGHMSLYLDGVLMAENLNIGYTTVNAHSNGAGLGATNSNNAFDSNNNNFNGWIDDFFMFGTTIDGSVINSLIKRADTRSRATTFSLPKATDAPSNVTVTPINSKSMKVTWGGVGAAAYEVLRSVDDDQNFQLVAVLEPTVQEFTDVNLNPRRTYFYAVRSLSVQGYSDLSLIKSATTPNSVPAVMTDIPDFSIFYEDEINLVVSAEDFDGDPLTFEAVNFPSFASLISQDGNTITLNIAPEAINEGAYSQLGVKAMDAFGGESAVVYFDLQVISNYDPVIDEVETSYEMFGAQSLTIPFIASDLNGDNLSWIVTGLPEFATTESSEDGLGMSIVFSPSLSTDGGHYFINVRVEDDNAVRTGFDEQVIELTVVPFDPNHKVYINFGSQSVAPSPWNNLMVTTPTAGVTLTDIKNDQGFVMSNMSVILETTWNGSGVSGGMPTGVYEDEARMSYFWSNSGPEYLRITGLDVNAVYNFDFFGSRNSGGDRTTVFGIGSETSQVQTSYNTDQIARLEGISPDVNGEIRVSVNNITYAGGFSIAYLNTLIVEAVSFSGIVPFAPSDLQLSLEGGVTLDWTDHAYNETGFEVFRSIGNEDNYELIATVSTPTYTDTNLSLQDQYYKVRAVNDFGNSAFSGSVHYEYSNREPLIQGYYDISIEAGLSRTISFSVTDPEGDDMSVDVLNLPAFATFEMIDANNGNIVFDATVYDLGTYTIEIEAIDINNNRASVTFVASVTEFVYETALINFSINSSYAVPAPWNNMIGTPSANLSISNISTTSGVNTGYALRLSNSWAGGNNSGINTGNNSGVYPDLAMASYFADNTTNNKDFVLSGLDVDKVYDLVFFGSRGDISDTRITQYTVGSTTVDLNATNNSTSVAEIKGLKPDAAGQIVFTVKKPASSPWKYINAMEIRFYEMPDYPEAPSNLTAQAESKQAIRLNWNDNSSNEDGFELYRSTSSSGPWTLISTLPAGVNQYIDQGLSTNTGYFYKARAFNDVSPSLYSNVVEEYTYSYYVYLNIGDENSIAPAPWNNTAQVPFVGNVTSDLKNDSGNNTGISMTVVANSFSTTFNTSGSQGSVTGDNSGVYPDVVLQSYYWIEQAEVASVKFSNLALNQQYDVIFFASRAATYRGTQFTIGEKSVSLNASFNTTETAMISDVVSDEIGNMTIDMRTMTGTNLAYVNAIVLKVSNAFGGNVEALAREREDVELKEELEVYQEAIVAYPNPFESEINLKVNVSENKMSRINIYNQMGQVVYTKSEAMLEGINELNINTSSLTSGMYFLQIQNEDDKIETIKLVKK
ncbi:fibronectin type III domain-containing protein [Reichenbachiella agarivorans]|uniref:Fibronectin type III domain-containing protein n=1 Tax=Reichenbachiella agarivorans TaxID=2979464 RepID=A0ABY6CPJ3_9BACT|nr:fibronectin type III domain-containing protein [Reichenbachiella agarivorans]UXP32432.1 fibronectin type III domain-containing protein [Reichenbachiella agarivorans]